MNLPVVTVDGLCEEETPEIRVLMDLTAGQNSLPTFRVVLPAGEMAAQSEEAEQTTPTQSQEMEPSQSVGCEEMTASQEMEPSQPEQTTASQSQEIGPSQSWTAGGEEKKTESEEFFAYCFEA